jgi:hypothetical protein
VSEYQYYEFQAIDRPLTRAQMAALRACSSRATITPTRFVNSYSYGRFKGDERKWRERYFDAFLYQANWGARHLSLRLPAAQLPFKEARRYCGGGAAEARRHGRYVIFDLSSDDEEGGDWVEEDDGQMASLVPLRGELAGGDLRPLYLAWLGRAQAGELEPDAVEPPPPPGLGSLTAPQEALADFLRLDRDLLLAAAAGSHPSLPSMDVADLRTWARELPESKKSELLVGLLGGDGERLRSDIVRDVRRTAEASSGLARRPPRTVASIVEHGERRSRARATGKGRRRPPAES